MLHSNFRKLFVILLKQWENFHDKPAAESGLLPLTMPFARKKKGDSGVCLGSIKQSMLPDNQSFGKQIKVKTYMTVYLVSTIP